MASPPQSPNLEHDHSQLSRDASVNGSGINVTLERSNQSSAQVERDKQKEKAPPTIICCSSEEEDFQVDICPLSWYNLKEANGFCDGVWKLCFLLCFLPLCYPCYLTRKFRRREKRLPGNESFASVGSRRLQARNPENRMIVTKAHRIEETADAIAVTSTAVCQLDTTTLPDTEKEDIASIPV